MSYLPSAQSATASSSRPVTYNPNPSQAISSGASDGTNPSTPLRSVKASNGFEYPPIWSFPPFFTLQPNPTTLSHQLGLWTTLVLNWARFSRVWEVNTDSPQPGDVFVNKTIGRKLLPPSMKQLLSHMVKEGQAVAEPPKQTSSYLLYWRKPEEWGTLIYDWITENGLGGSIMTFYEITDGDLSFTTEFREMPPSLLRKSLDTLVKRGKAQIIKGEGEAGEGVRFL